MNELETLLKQIQTVKYSSLNKRVGALYEWLKYDKQETLLEVIELVQLYDKAIAIIEADRLQKPTQDPTQFYPMSYSPKPKK